MKDKNMLILGAVAIVAIIFLVMLFQAQISASAIRKMPTNIGQRTDYGSFHKQFMQAGQSIPQSTPRSGPIPGMYSGGAGQQSNLPPMQTGMPKSTQPGYPSQTSWQSMQKTQELIKKQQEAHRQQMEIIRNIR